MPSSGRAVWPLRSTLRTADLYPTLNAGLWPTVAANSLWGATVTAAADPAEVRVRVDVYWPAVTTAQVVRVHADGTEHLVRGGDPAAVCTGWARYDHEAPLDVPVTYRVTSAQAPGGSWDSAGPVTVDSGGTDWLKHVSRPYLNRVVHVREMPARQLNARRGTALPEDSAYPIVVYQTRQADVGQVLLQTDGSAADEQALRALLADGAPLLLQRPAVRGGESLYISVDTSDVAPLDVLDGTQLMRRFGLPFEVIDRPDGAAAGAAGQTYADLAAAYVTYAAAAAGEPSYLEQSLAPGP